MAAKQTITIEPNKSVLVVEDDPNRIAWFHDNLKHTRLTVASSVNKAINVLGAHSFDMIFLDHDAVPMLVDTHDPDYDTKTFFRVAELLAATGYSGTVVIHSHNPVGAKRMEYILGRNARVVRLPFGMFSVN